MLYSILVLLNLSAAPPSGPPIQLDGPFPEWIRTCSRIEDSLQRLSCFDELARALRESEATVEASRRPEWEEILDTDPIDDASLFGIYRRSNGSLSNGNPAVLMFKCHGPDLALLVILTPPLKFRADPASNTSELRLRLDRRKATSSTALVGEDRTSAFLADPASTAKEMQKSKLLLVDAYSEDGERLIMEFNLEGFASPSRRVLQACSRKGR